jgi:hypothetical protein
MKFLKTTALAVIVLTTVIACNHSANSIEGSNEKPKNISLKEEEANKFFTPRQNAIPDTTVKFQQGKPQTESKTKSEANPDWDKKIVKNASVNLEVKNYKSFNEMLHADIKKYGGYIAQEEQNQTDYKIENTIAIKVPVNQFDDLVAILTSGDQKLVEKKISSEDVTTEVVDTKSRMEAKKQVRLKYLDLLKQAKNMEEILNVQNEINGIQEDIEAATGRIGYLSHSAAYSTINLTYFQVLDASAKNTGEVSYRSKVWQSFKNGWNWVGEVFIGIISIWPLFLLGFACWFAYRKWLLAKTQKRNA